MRAYRYAVAGRADPRDAAKGRWLLVGAREEPTGVGVAPLDGGCMHVRVRVKGSMHGAGEKAKANPRQLHPRHPPARR